MLLLVRLVWHALSLEWGTQRSCCPTARCVALVATNQTPSLLRRRVLIGQIILTLSVFRVRNTEELLPNSQLCCHCCNQSDTVPATKARSYWSDYLTLSVFRVGNTEELLPNSQLCCDSLAVRATSYALLVYTLRREAFVRPIVRWINTRSAILSTAVMFLTF
jgi:hypothetical protein